MSNGEEILALCWSTLQKRMCLESALIQRQLSGYKPSEIHCIQYVGDHDDVNVTKMAEAFNMTTGGVTKLTKKLVEKGLLRAHKSPENKKNVYFTLTETGKSIYHTHQALHRSFAERDREILASLSDEDYARMQAFLQRYSDHLDAALAKEGVDVRGEDRL